MEHTPGVGDGQGGLACCNSWGRKESDMTERLDWTELKMEHFSEGLVLFEILALKFQSILTQPPSFGSRLPVLCLIFPLTATTGSPLQAAGLPFLLCHPLHLAFPPPHADIQLWAQKSLGMPVICGVFTESGRFWEFPTTGFFHRNLRSVPSRSIQGKAITVTFWDVKGFACEQLYKSFVFAQLPVSEASYSPHLRSSNSLVLGYVSLGEAMKRKRDFF